MTYGNLTFHKYCEKIDQVTSRQINEAAYKLLTGMPTMVITGGEINMVPTITDVRRQFNWSLNN